MYKDKDKKTDIRRLKQFIAADNICDLLDDTEISKVGHACSREYDIDESSRAEWTQHARDAIKLAKLDKEDKTFPWPGAANVKFPLLTNASIQFASRVFPEIVRGNRAVKCEVIGEDHDGAKEDQASRVSEHMSYQVIDEMPEWVEGTDRLLHVLPIVGCCFKKTYFCSVKMRNVSEYVSALDVVINYNAKSLETARRISHTFPIYENDIWEMVQAGVWRDADIPLAQDQGGDESPQHTFVEQHRFLDLDEDGYEEPYIVTYHKGTSQVVRIKARYTDKDVHLEGNKLIRIKPRQFFTKFPFIPNPDGGFYDLGFGALLLPINEAINTVLNELLDAGALSNAGGGFVAKGVMVKGGAVRFQLGEWKQVNTTAQDLRGGIVPLPVKEPSQVLFALLGFLKDTGNELAAVANLMSGEQLPTNAPATTVLAMIEQGLAVFNGIYKRVHAAFTREYKKLYELNSQYLDEDVYFRVMDDQKQASRGDYDTETFNVRPIGEASMSSEIQRMARLNALMLTSGRPNVNEDALTKRYLERINEPNPDELIIPPEARPQPGPDPLLIDAQSRAETEGLKRRHMEVKLRLELHEIESMIKKNNASAAKLIAEAEAESSEFQISDYKDKLEQMTGLMQQQQDTLRQMQQQQRGAMLQQPQQTGGIDGGIEAGGLPALETG